MKAGSKVVVEMRAVVDVNAAARVVETGSKFDVKFCMVPNAARAVKSGSKLGVEVNFSVCR